MSQNEANVSAVYAVCAVCAPCANDEKLHAFEQLVEAIEAAGTDITSAYENWYKIAIAIASEFGERMFLHTYNQ